MRWGSIFVWSLITITFLTLFTTSLCLADDWHYFILPSGQSAPEGIKVDSYDLPHIIYYYSPYAGLRYAHYNGTEWVYETIPGSGSFGYVSMVLDNQDFPHISCHEWYDEDLMYGWYDGSDWIFEMVDDEDDVGLFSSLALDSDGYPHITYRHNIFGVGKNLRYAYKDVYGWHIEVVDDEFQFQGSYCSIALDSQDHPHIAYSKYIPTEYADYLSYAHWDGSQWLIETVEEMGYAAYFTSIAVDSQDHPHIAYPIINHVHYAHWNGTDWVIEDVDFCHGDVSLCLDSQEYPHITYSGMNKLNYARWNGSEWKIEVVCDEGILGDFKVLLDLDSEDKPHILCDEWTNHETWYIWFGDPLTDITLDHFSAHAEGSAIAINWTVQTTPPMAGGEHIAGFNLYRREINNNIAAEVSNLGCIWTKVNTGLITGENPYSYTDSGVVAGVAYEYKLEAVLTDDSPETLGTTQATAGIPPTSFAILSVYPNPASEQLTVSLSLPNTEIVELAIYDIAGRLIMQQSLGELPAGEKSVILNTKELASGVYTLSASSPSGEDNDRMVIVR